MIEFLLSPAAVPFSIALGLLAGLLVLEILALLLGGTFLGQGAEEADFGGGIGLDKSLGVDLVDLPDAFDLDTIDLGDLDPGDLDLGDGPAVDVSAAASGGLAGMLGLGKVPFMIWLAALLAGFGLTGYVVQSVAASVLGAPLSLLIALPPAAVAGLWFARGYGRVLARLIPKTESSVYTKAMLNRRRGTVSQGTARRNSPAEVRVQDAYGNLHFIRAEPLDCNDTIPAGTDVLVLRVRLGPERGKFRILALSAI